MSSRQLCGNGISPTWSRNSAMALVPPGRAVSEARILDPRAGLLLHEFPGMKVPDSVSDGMLYKCWATPSMCDPQLRYGRWPCPWWPQRRVSKNTFIVVLQQCRPEDRYLRLPCQVTRASSHILNP